MSPSVRCGPRVGQVRPQQLWTLRQYASLQLLGVQETAWSFDGGVTAMTIMGYNSLVGGDWNHGIWWLPIGWDPTDELHHFSEGLKPPIRWCLWFFMVIQWGLNGDLLMFNISFSWRSDFFWTKPPSNWWIIIRIFSDCGNMHQQKLGVLMTRICKHGDLTRKNMEFI